MGWSMKSWRPAKATIFGRSASNLVARHADEEAVDNGVFAAADVGMEARAELEQGRKTAGRFDRALARPRKARHHAEERALAAAVGADDAEELALGDIERDVAHGPERLARAARFPGAPRVEERRLELGARLGHGVALRDVGQPHRDRGGVSFDFERGDRHGTHTMSAKASSSCLKVNQPSAQARAVQPMEATKNSLPGHVPWRRTACQPSMIPASGLSQFIQR